MISTWRKILGAPRFCLFLSRRESLGPTLVRLLLTWSQSRLTRRGARFSFGCVLCGSRECKERSSNCYRYDAFHLSAPLGVRTSSRKDCRTRTARKWVRSFTLNFRLLQTPPRQRRTLQGIKAVNWKNLQHISESECTSTLVQRTRTSGEVGFVICRTASWTSSAYAQTIEWEAV